MDFAVLLLIVFTLALAAANGANDNIKGAATLLGSGVMSYRTAIVLAIVLTIVAALLVASGGFDVLSGSLWVTVAMAAGGSIAAGRLADTLAFKVTRMDAGEGLGGNLVTAALVIGASRYGLPVSTTHVSTGALFGIAVANGSGRWAVIRTILLAWGFTLPTACMLAFLVAKCVH
jgi:phosphate/sulfate permease